MTAWYSGSPDKEDEVELVRLYVGDTDKSSLILQDDEIRIILKYQTNLSLAAAVAARFIAAKFSACPDVEIGKTKVKYSDRAPYFNQLADKLAKGGAGLLPGTDGTGVPNVSVFVGGISKTKKVAQETNTDRRDENFEIGHRDIKHCSNTDPDYEY